ncbi:hypothetical protein ACP6H1_27180 [Vibrio harveyi]|uniref:hypothetical protein n=1 Tax=Vibrio harveyi TaxID=669 RepID=UPI003CF2178E
MTTLSADYSAAAISRRFESIADFRIELANIDATLLWDKNTLVASVISTAQNPNGRYPVLASLELEQTDWKDKTAAYAVERFWEKESMQVRGVVTDPSRRDMGLATYIYETLVLKLGFTLVSDNEQYEGGKALWKKIAAHSRKLNVYVLDSDTLDFHPYGKDGRTIYTGSNIDDVELWSIDPDQSKYGIVLVAEPVAA